MQSIAVEASFAVKKDSGEFAAKDDIPSAASPHGKRELIHEPVGISLKEEDRVSNSMVNNGESCNDSKQLVLYEPKGNVSQETSVHDPVNDNHSVSVSKCDPKANVSHGSILCPDPLHCQPPLLRGCAGSNTPSRVSPSVGAYTVQCANCFKWRLIPTKAKYEEIREHIIDQPFVCDTAQEWRPAISCDDPPDIEQDGSRLWAIDKPSIAQSPRGNKAIKN